jgi:energy-converting hydrogenase Eha subunit H
MAIIGLPLPIQLINGNIADGGQVQTDLNYIASNVNANAAKNGVNNDITALTALTSIVSGLSITGATITSSTFTGGTITLSFIDGTNTGVTQAVGTSTTQLATTEFVANQAFSTALPLQTGNAGKFLKTNGASASWVFLPPDVQISYRFGAF